MSLYDCPKCWEVLCTCGYAYRKWDTTRLTEFIATLQKIVDSRKPVEKSDGV